MTGPSQIQDPQSKIAKPYTALAEGYEAIMEHVDYAHWAGHAHELLQRHAPAAWRLGPQRLLELGCGTGTLARGLQPRGPYRYLATDGSEAMLAVARRKARAQSLPVRFRPLDFTRLAEALPRKEKPSHAWPLAPPFDAVLLLYDGLNYLLEERQIERLLAGVAAALRPGGLFLFDQSTPVNSANPDGFTYDGAFEDASGRTIRYRRASRYDPARRLHETVFELEGPAAGQRATERHVQRAYAPGEIRRLVRASPLAEVAIYDGFTTDPATAESHRVHWMTQLGV